MPDLMEYFDLAFFDWVIYRGNAGLGPDDIERWFGISQKVGPFMSYWILAKSGIPVFCSTFQKLTNLGHKINPFRMIIKNDTIDIVHRLESQLDQDHLLN